MNLIVGGADYYVDHIELTDLLKLITINQNQNQNYVQLILQINDKHNSYKTEASKIFFEVLKNLDSKMNLHPDILSNDLEKLIDLLMELEQKYTQAHASIIS